MVAWFVENVDPFLLRDFLITCIWGFFILTVVSFVVLVVHKIQVERREARLVSLRERYLSSIHEKLKDPSCSLQKPVSVVEFLALAEAGIQFLSDGPLESHARVHLWMRDVGLPAFLERRVRQGRGWIDRFLALEKLGFLSLSEENTFYWELVGKEPEEMLRAKAVWALSRIAGAEDLKVINEALSHPAFMSAKFSEFIYVNVIDSFRARGESAELARLFDGARMGGQVPVMILRDMVEACGFCRFTEGRPFVLALHAAYPDRSEVRLTCLRALGQLGSGEGDAALIEGLDDPDPRVRAVAARGAGEAGVQDAAGALDKLLGDANYHVRVNAAMALGQLGEVGRATLSRRTEDPDRFVREACRYMLEETCRV